MAPQPSAYRRAAVSFLLVLFALSFLDRQIINILAEAIKADLNLADWQIGLMSGLAFAALYTVAGLPIARLADRAHRPRIIGVAVVLWSLFTASCGFVGSFVQLLAARVGVGIGEAGLTPPATSLIMDYAPPEKRASTLAQYHMGVPLGSLLGLALGGLLFDWVGWRHAFLVVGAPGVLMGVAAMLILREPRSKGGAVLAAQDRGPGYVDTFWALAGIRSYRLFVLATAFQAFVSYGQAPFIAPFFFRLHGAQLADMAASVGLQRAGFLGLALGLAHGIAGLLGVWLGGQLADRIARGDVRHYGTVPSVAALLTIPTFIIAILTRDAGFSLLLLAVPSLFNAMWFGPVHTTQQSVVPKEMRATATAVLLLILNLIGLGLGPLAVGLLSDWLGVAWKLGPGRGVQVALIMASFVALIPAWLFFIARKSIPAELRT
jgi:MFS family permease